jgi:hypothetical protein
MKYLLASLLAAASLAVQAQPLQMMQWTAAGSGQRLALIVRHDDAEREYAYDRESSIGRLDRALDEAKANNWIVVSMKSDWKRIFSFEGAKP